MNAIDASIRLKEMIGQLHHYGELSATDKGAAHAMDGIALLLQPDILDALGEHDVVSTMCGDAYWYLCEGSRMEMAAAVDLFRELARAARLLREKRIEEYVAGGEL